MLKRSLPFLVLATLAAACGTSPGETATTLPSDVSSSDAGDADTLDVPEPDAAADVAVPDIGTPDVTEPDVVEEVGVPEEVCDNGLDDDGDGASDCDDADCDTADACLPHCGVEAFCSIAGDELPLTDIFARPLDLLTCWVETPPELSATEVYWSVVEAPAGSRSQPDPADQASTEFFVDLAGRYLLTAEVRYASGCLAQSSVTVVSRPMEDVHVQLVWHTPDDPDESDSGFGAGTDLDLHYLHPNGCWQDTTWDCHSGSPSPDWQDGSQVRLDLDDTDGAGPENTNHDEPANGNSYRIAVNYHSDHGYGVSYATLRIYIFGELVLETRDRELSEGDWWVVAAISWPSTEIIPIDLTYDDVPDCGL